MKKFIILLLITIRTFTVFAQQEVYTLTDIQYDIKGSTQPFFFENRLDLNRGLTFKTLEEIKTFEETVKQEIENLRIYEEFSVETIITGNSVVLLVYLDEAWGLIPFGYPKYDSEEGGRIGMKLYWYNSLGTLTDTLFQGGVNIGLNSDDDLELQTWDAQVGVSDILINSRYYDFHYKQELDRESKDDEEWSFYSSKVKIGTTFELFGILNYSPKISLESRYAYKPVDESILEEDIIENPITLSYTHGFSKDTVNWVGNFRDGYKYGIGNSIHMLYTDEGDLKPATDFTLFGAYYKAFGTSPISISSKLTGTISINNELLGLGSKVRGVDSGDLYGDMGLFSNNNIYIRVIKIENFAEAIFAPHFDMGITDNLDFKYGAGADFILYVDKLKSLVARGSVSWDLTDFDVTDFKLDITSSLFF
ncbi:MAG: hypothetical protein OCD02_01000 [Spirochaetaceae bacterium]